MNCISSDINILNFISIHVTVFNLHFLYIFFNAYKFIVNKFIVFYDLDFELILKNLFSQLYCCKCSF